MSETRVPLSEQEEAHVALIIECHAAAVAEAKRQYELAVQIADRLREERFRPLRTVHMIPEGIDVKVMGRLADAPAFLVFESPDIAPEPPRPDAESRTEKSTDAVQASGA